MQRVFANLGRAAPPVVAGAAAAHRAPTVQTQNGSAAATTGAPVYQVEEHEGFMHVGFDTPVQQQEVAAALTDLSVLGGVVAHRPPATVVPVPAPYAVPLIEEVAESDASSECSEANRLMASVDACDPFFAPASPMDAASTSGSSSALDLLASTVTNVLNNDEVVSVISRHLARDPAFMALMDRVNPGLPAPARMLLLEELGSETGSVVAEESELAPLDPNAASNPLLHLLSGIQRGVMVAGAKLGEAFCHLGNFLRNLGFQLKIAMAGMEEGAGNGRRGDQRRSLQFEAAVLKVACAVAVLVLTRRVTAVRVVV